MTTSFNPDYCNSYATNLRDIGNDAELFQAIVDTPFHDKLQAGLLNLGIVVLLLHNTKTGMIDRVALSQTEQAAGAVKVSVKPFNDIKIPANHHKNIIAKAILDKRPQQTSDWEVLFTPALSADEARLNQAGAGVGYSIVYPINTRDGGAMIFSFFGQPGSATAKHHEFMKSYSQIVAKVLAR